MSRCAFLFVVALSASAVFSCHSSKTGVRQQGGTTILEIQSDHCFLGSSDPWMDNVSTWNEAAQDAVKNLFEAHRSAAIRSGSVSFTATDGVDYADKMLIAEIKATLSGARVVGWWMDRAGAGPRGMCGKRCSKATVWAVACVDGHEAEASRVLPEAFMGGIPEWLKNQKPSKKQLCAVGISGRTIKPEDAVANAIDDARRRVAVQICAVGDHAFVDYLSGGTYSFPDSQPSPAAVAHVNEVAGTDAEKVNSWLDADGVGPLGAKGAAYARVCIPRPAVECAMK